MQLREFLVKKSIRAKELKDFSILPVYGVSNVDGICVTGNNPGEKKDEYVLIEENDFAYNPYRVNVGSIGLTPKGMKGLVSPAYVVFQTNENLLPELLWSFIKSKEGLTQIISHARGTVRKALRFEDLCKIDMYIPPKNEQKKILKKLQNLNSKIQNLKSETSYQLDLLKKLKQQILQDSVQGKLVKQDPKDEPASVLLKKIKAEKEKLFSEKKLKPGKPLPPIKEEEIPFQIPENWVWCRLGETSINFKRGPFGSSITKIMFEPKSKETTKIYEQKNAIYKNYKLGNYFIDLEKYPNLKSFITKPGDIIISCAGTIGETYIIPNDAPLGIINQALLKLELQNEPILKKYFLLFFESFFKSKINIDAKGSAMKNLGSIKYLKNSIFPLPPLSDQHRIVLKVEELMKKCNELEASIKQGQTYTDQLMQSVLRDALKPGGMYKD